ncbi:hypothetical protein [Pseudomonas fluorescens group sp. PF-69]
MNEQERRHDIAVGWIVAEIDNLICDLGKPNASAAATSSITLAYMLRAIDDAEHRQYRARIDEIYVNYNASLTQGAAA